MVMKKKIGILALCLLCVMCFGMTVQAAGLLSPAISHLQSECAVLKTGVGTNTVSFSPEDFTEILGDMDAGIVITSLPALSDGVLKLGALDVAEGQIIARDALRALRFVPAAAGKTADFGFIPYGAVYEDAFVCTVYMLDSLNFAPTASASLLFAVESVPTQGMLSAADPDGDAVSYELLTVPARGEVRLEKNGIFRYTPYEGGAGEDSFTYVATDRYGNRSQPATVTIRTEKNEKQIVYSDMTEKPEAGAAAVLAAEDIFVGEKVGSEWYFHPEKTVTRGEFLVMAMKLFDIETELLAADDSGFADKGAFTAVQDRYITTAADLGIVYGMDTEAGRGFFPNENITAEQAAMIVSRMASLCGRAFGEAVPVSAGEMITDEDLATLAAAGVAVPSERGEALTRAEAAALLYSVEIASEK